MILYRISYKYEVLVYHSHEFLYVHLIHHESFGIPYLDAGDESFGFQWIVFRFEVHYYFSDIFPSGNTQNV